MKILVMNGSPHRGNTWRLTQCVREMIQQWDKTVEFTELHLTDIGLPFCTGCSNCFRKGHRYCPHNEKIQPIMDLIDKSDAVIFSVSCFQGHLTGIMKNFTDHLAFLIHRPRYFYKKALIISTTGGVGADSTTKALAATLAGWGFNKSYQLPIAAYSWNAYEPGGRDLQKTEKAATRFYQDVKSNSFHPPSIGVLIPFNLFQAMCSDKDGDKQYPTEDDRFWPQYAGMQYAPGIPLPIHKRLFGMIFHSIGKHLGRKMVISYKK
ncbi:MAG: NAD(P)H-dependent oxidoreductase [Bacillota bacterium]|nr:NAD(P)H-dependent oxidoreductase [Bacillota bacterium]